MEQVLMMGMVMVKQLELVLELVLEFVWESGLKLGLGNSKEQKIQLVLGWHLVFGKQKQ
jgi:hypothetical protein